MAGRSKSTAVRDAVRVVLEAVRLHRAGRLEEAAARYRQAVALAPNYADAHNRLGVALQALGKNEEAERCFLRALELKPDQATVHNNLGIALMALNRPEEAVAQYERAIALKPGYTDAHNNLGNVLAGRGELETAAAQYEHVLRANPNYMEAHHNLANIHRMQGRFGEAMEHYDRAIAIRPTNAEAHYGRSEIRTFRAGDVELEALEKLEAQVPWNRSVYVHFALAKAYEDIGDYRRAFGHMEQGNALKRKLVQYEEARHAEMFGRIRKVFTRELLEKAAGLGEPSGVPVFVLGMPRSGSTLVEQILASHPQVYGAGELPDLANLTVALGEGASYPECVASLDGEALRRLGAKYAAGLRAPEGARRVVDKATDNFRRIGLIRMMLPNAKIIHTVRNPVDTCVSCYSKLFTAGQNFTYEMGELGRYYRHYSELMAHWREVLPRGAMLEVRYEDVVEDLEGEARKMVEFCGLEWDARCVKFHDTKRTVNTASAVQVRQPLFRTSVERWRRYENELGDLLEELSKVPGWQKARSQGVRHG